MESFLDGPGSRGDASQAEVRGETATPPGATPLPSPADEVQRESLLAAARMLGAGAEKPGDRRNRPQTISDGARTVSPRFSPRDGS